MPSSAPTQLELVACNLCGGNDFTVRYNSPLRVGDQEVGDFMASTDRFDRYGRIVRCRRCGLVYANPRPSRRQISDAYARVADHDYAEESSSRSINAHLSLHTIRRFVDRGRLLDVGCATGYFLNAARISFEPHGVELSRWAVEHARTVLNLPVHQGSLEDADFPDGWFDVVTLTDVIEHLTDPRACLEKVHRLLRPQGLLYLVTPNIDSLSAHVLRGRWWGLRPAHLYYFSAKTLTAMLAKVGFEPVRVKSYGRVFTYSYWASRLKSYPRPVPAVVNALIRWLNIEDKVLYLDTRDSVEVCALRR